MLVIMGSWWHTRAVAMDSFPAKDTNGAVLHDGELKCFNTCWDHYNETKSAGII